MHQICNDYPELQARIVRFRNSNSIINESTLHRVGMTQEEMDRTAAEYLRKLQTTERIRRDKNLDPACYVPSALMPSNPMLVGLAKTRFLRSIGGGSSQPDPNSTEVTDGPAASELVADELVADDPGRDQGAMAQLQALVRQQDRRRLQIEKQMLQSIELQATRQSQLEEEWTRTLTALTSKLAALTTTSGQGTGQPHPPG